MGSTTRGPGVSVIVLTYDSAASLPACLASLRPQVTALDGELVVVDNDSTDATVEVARDLGVHPLATGANLGFAAGCNVGARAAAGATLVFVNPDAELDEGCLLALMAALEEAPDVGLAGGRAHTHDGSYDARCALGRPSLWGAVAFATGMDAAFRHHPRLDPEHGPATLPAEGSVVGVGAVSGALLAVRRPVWERLGGFDERFFLYGEDVDLCLRAARLGMRTVVATAAGYRHTGGASSSGGTRDELLHRGKVELYRRHLSPAASGLAVAALQVGALLRGAAAFLPGARLSGRGRRWWELFTTRRRWRTGYAERTAGSVAS
jgi:N-acetylglucosaminyl-diphospho-decaprenol L-rhamnosyltransferase